MKALTPTTNTLVKLCTMALLGAVVPGVAMAQGSTGPVERHNMRAIGYNDLQARSAYQPTIVNQGGRWIAYIGHHGGESLNPLTGQIEPNGVSILDVTDPTAPEYLHHLPGAGGAGEAGGRQMARVCSGDVLPSGESGKWYMLTTLGNQAHEIYDVTNPENPTLLTTVVDGLLGTHKNWWECETGIGYLVSGVPGWNTNRHLQVFNLSDPANPVFIRNFGLPGDQPGATPDPNNPNPGLHGPIVVGNRVYMGYGTRSDGIMQILDKELLVNGPAEPTDENLLAPQISRLELGKLHGAHTTLPLLGISPPEFEDFTEGQTRDMVAIIGESIGGECMTPNNMMLLADVTTETEPHIVSNYHVDPRSSKFGNFCERGGTFGTHASHENMNNPYGNKVVFLSYWNAGVRAVDVRNPWSPRELAFYVPRVNPRTDERCVTRDGVETCKIAVQTNNVEVDDRGFIYAADRANSGLHILELTDEAKKELTRRPEAGTPPYDEN